MLTEKLGLFCLKSPKFGEIRDKMGTTFGEFKAGKDRLSGFRI